MSTLIGLSALLGLLFLNVAAMAAGRHAAARAFRIEGARFPFGDGPPESYDRASPWARPAIVASGPLANYLCAATLLFLGALLTGDVKPPGTTVDPVPDRPAAIAGMRNGDRVLAIDGAPIETWKQMSATFQAHPGEPLDVLVAREGKELHIEVTPSRDGKIGVTPTPEHEPVSVTDALWRGISGPPRVLYGIGLGLVQIVTGSGGELAGPAAIVKETARASDRTGELLFWLGGMNAYCLPIFLFVSVLTTPRRRKSAPPPGEPGPGS